MPDPKLQQPDLSNRSGWRFRLWTLFNRTTRPAALGPMDDDEGDSREGHEPQLADLLKLAAERKHRYDTFDAMDNGLVASVLDAMAEEVTQVDLDTNKTVWVESKADHIRDAVEGALHNCQIEDCIQGVTRRMAKYGDAYRALLYASGSGVLGWAHASTSDTVRVEDKYGRLVGYTQTGKKFRGAFQRDVSWPWDFINFRLYGAREEKPSCGTSVLEAAFRPWRQMTLNEDSLLMFRLRKTPERAIIMVPVGDLGEAESTEFLRRWMKRFRKTEFIDPASPQYRKRYNPLTPLEDIFIPMRDGQQEPRIETMAGAANIGEVYDLEHFRDAFFGSVRMPKAFFGFEGEIDAKATLVQLDIRAARTMKRLRRAQIFGLRRMCDTSLTLRGSESEAEVLKYDFSKKGQEYLLKMVPISFLDEYERLELMKMRYEILQQLQQFGEGLKIDARAWAAYILMAYARLPEDLVLRLTASVPKATDQEAASGGGAGFDALPPEAQEQILDRKGKARLGFYPLNENEQAMIGRLIHASPGLRLSISNFAELGMEESAADGWRTQVDPATANVWLPGGKKLPENGGGDPLLQELLEDIEKLRGEKSKVLTD